MKIPKVVYMRLTESAVVIPDVPLMGSQVLGRGSIVAHLPTGKPSPITGKENEPYVRWIDGAFQEHHGWLAQHTLWKRAASDRVMRAPFHRRDCLSAWDHLRARITNDEVGLTVLKPVAREWIIRHADAHRAELIAVAREYGVRKSVAEACTTAKLASCVLALTLDRRYTMSNAKKDTETVVAADVALDTEAKKARKAKSGKQIAKDVVAKKKAAPAKAAVKKSTKKVSAPAPKEEAAERAPRGDAGEYKKTLGAEIVKNLKAAGIKDALDKAGLLRDGKKISTASMGEVINACWAGKAKARAAKNETVAVKLHSLARKVNLLRRKATAK